MRNASLFAALAAAVVMALFPIAAIGGDASYASAETSQYRLGYDLGMPEDMAHKTYTFGVLGNDGSCSTMEVEAMHPSYAYHYVKELCPDCLVEDITGLMYQGEAAWEVVPMSEKYCSLRE